MKHPVLQKMLMMQVVSKKSRKQKMIHTNSSKPMVVITCHKLANKEKESIKHRFRILITNSIPLRQTKLTLHLSIS